LYRQNWYKATANPNLVVRAAPDVGSEKLGNIPLDGKVNVLEITDKKDFISGNDGTWVKIEWKEGAGYTFDAFLKPITTQVSGSETNVSDNKSVTEDLGSEKVNDSSLKPKPEDESPSLDDIRSILPQLFTGETIFDQGKYSQVQIEALFDQNFKDKELLVSGEIANIGKDFSGDKYIHVKVLDDHFVDIYPAEDFNVLAYSNGQTVTFAGKWTKIGTGIMIAHVVKAATLVGNL